jgi:MSHA biogenesis protein MshN
MNVINQVFNKSGCLRPDQSMLRAAHRRLTSMLGMALLLALALLLANGITELQWRQIFKTKQVAAGVIRHLESVAPYTTLTSPVQPAVIDPPASRLSFELSSAPLQSSDKHAELRTIDRMPAPQGISAIPATQFVVQGMKQLNPLQQAEADYHKAVSLMQQGKINAAISGLEAVLRLDVSHEAARQSLASLLQEAKRNEDAERVLQEGLKLNPEHTNLAMLLARLQMEHGSADLAEATLSKSMPYAYGQAGYQAFFAALLQRKNRHKEAISHFQTALKLAPDNGVWLTGYAISLQASQRTNEAREAYHRALETQTLNKELQVLVQQKLKTL